MNVKRQVIGEIRKLSVELPTAKILFTGHSRGGGLCLISAMDLIDEIPSLKGRVQFIGYGIPRIVNNLLKFRETKPL